MLKLIRILPLLLLCLGLMSAPARADEDTPLAKAMGEMNKSLKAVKKSLDAGDLAAIVAPVREAQKATLKSFEFLPASLEKVPAAEKEKAAADYRLQMSQFHSKLYELELAALKGDKEAANKIFKEIGAQKKKGHDDYKKEDK